MSIDRDINKFLAEAKVTSKIYTCTTTEPQDIEFRDARDAGSIAYILTHVSGTETIAAAKIVANTLANGSGDEAVIKTVTVATARQPDAAGDYIVEEILASDIAQKAAEDGKDYRYVSFNMDSSASTGTWALTTIMSDYRFKTDSLTADYIS